jgi:hypothetical protein
MEVVFASMFDDPPHLLRNTIHPSIDHLNRHTLPFFDSLLLTLLLVAAGREVLCHVPSNPWPGMFRCIDLW